MSAGLSRDRCGPVWDEGAGSSVAASAPTSSSAESARTPRSCRSSPPSRVRRSRRRARRRTSSAGISGLTDQDADAAALLSLLAGTGIRSTVLAHDSTTSYLGALGDTRGAVVASGTGVVTLAVGVETVARVDGWGYIMGDAGSGYWIGRAGTRRRDARRRRPRAADGTDRRPAPAVARSDSGVHRPAGRRGAREHRGDLRRRRRAPERSRRCRRGGDHPGSGGRARAQRHDALRRVAHPEDDRFSVCAMGGVFRSVRSKRLSQPRCPPTSAAPRWISSRHAARASTAPSPSPGSPRGMPSPPPCTPRQSRDIHPHPARRLVRTRRLRSRARAHRLGGDPGHRAWGRPPRPDGGRADPGPLPRRQRVGAGLDRPRRLDVRDDVHGRRIGARGALSPRPRLRRARHGRDRAAQRHDGRRDREPAPHATASTCATPSSRATTC